MNYSEYGVVFRCAGESLVGVLALPEAASDTAFVIIVGGPQYRAGSHRQFVALARAVAAGGHAALRFDCRGMGDSSGAPRSFEDTGDDIAAAVDLALARVPGAVRVVLCGLCDGAAAALLYCQARRDARVAGLALYNPWVRSEAGLARTHVKHYYARRLLQRGFWTKLLRGGVAFGALAGFASNLRLAAAAGGRAATNTSYQARMAAAWSDSSRRLLLVISGDDYTAKEFIDHAGRDAAWAGAFAHPGLQRHDLATADHTFSDPADQRRVEELTLAWLDRSVAVSDVFAGPVSVVPAFAAAAAAAPAAAAAACVPHAS